MKTWLRGNISVNIQGRIMLLCTAFPLTLIYVYYKFYLNVNSSFLPDYMLPPLGSIEMVHSDAI